jgi:hypothetical protein
MFADLTLSRLLSNSFDALDENLDVRERMDAVRDGMRSVRDGAREFLARHNQAWSRVKPLLLSAAIASGLVGCEPGVGIALGAYVGMVVVEGVFHRPAPALPDGPVHVPPQVNFYGSTASARTAL